MNYTLFFTVGNFLNFKLITNEKLFYEILRKRYFNFLVKRTARNCVLLNVFFNPNYEKKYDFNFAETSRVSYNTTQTDTIIDLKKRTCNIVSLVKGERLFLVFSQTLPFIFSIFNKKQNTLLFHSSSVLFNGKLYVFSGKADAGKSTIAEILQKSGGKVLNDEFNLLECKGNEIFLTSLPFRGDFIPRKYSGQIANIIFIHKSKKNKRTNLSRPNFFRKAVQQAYAFSFKKTHIDLGRRNAITILFKISKLINSYGLQFKNDASFLSLLP